jgi:hypothetical protein
MRVVKNGSWAKGKCNRIFPIGTYKKRGYLWPLRKRCSTEIAQLAIHWTKRWVGPPLRNITAKQDEKWLVDFIRDSQEVDQGRR